MKLLFVILLGGSVLSQVAPEPIVFGPQAAALRPFDVQGMTHAVAPHGGTPWLLTDVRRSPMLVTGTREWMALAYLPPVVATPVFRRGPLVRLSTAASTEEWPDPATWRADGSTIRTWAQVALPGRAFADVTSDEDENRPLHISGDITDADLLSIVRFLRSNPALPNPRRLHLRAEHGPVRTIWGPEIRHPYLPGARVTLGLGPGCGYDVFLERNDGAWTGSVEGSVSCH